MQYADYAAWQRNYLQGEVLETLWDPSGVNHPMITSMREHKGWLYLGGLSNNRIGRYRLPVDGSRPDFANFVHYAQRWGAGFSRGAAASPVA